MNRKTKLKNWYLDHTLYVYSVGLTTLVIVAMWLFNQLGPFGGYNMMLIDGIHQYVPFFSEWYEKIRHGSGLLYTWNVGMGGNFLSLFSYYLSSPMNLLILLFDKEHIVDGISLVLSLKFILTSFCMAYFLKHKKGEKPHELVLAALTLAYTFSAFVIGYNWCLMWMDVIMVFPLVLLGFERLMDNRDYRMYTLALFYTLYCNYYMGFIVCLFLVFWFFLYEHQNIRNFFVHGIRFAVASLTGAAMAAVLLVPAYYGIMNTSSGNSMALPESNWYGNVLNILQKLLIAIEPVTNQTFDGGANLYCGIFVLVGALMFVFSGRVKLWTRFRYILMLAFLTVSMNNELLNYIWHAFHNQYGIPNRFSFCFIMMLILMADSALTGMEHSGQSVGARGRALVLFLIGIVLCGGVVALFYFGAEESLPLYCYLISAGMLVIYLVIGVLYLTGMIGKMTYVILFSVFAIGEILGNGIYGLSDNGSVCTETYLQDTDNVAVLKDYMDEQMGTEFYRSDLLKSRMLDEATWHNLHSIGIFGSTVPGDMVTAMGKLGFYTGANEYLYHGSTPLTNSMMNVKYALVREDAYNQLGFHYVTEEGGVGLYENPYYLPIGFMVKEDLLDYEMSWDVFETQNQIAQVATGLPVELFDKFDFPCYVFSSQGEVGYSEAPHQISYTRTDTAETTISAIFTVPEDMDLYLNCKGNNIKNIALSIDGNMITQDRYQLQVFHVGQVTAGQQIQIDYLLNAGGNLTGTLNLYAASYDNAAFEDVYHVLSGQTMTEVSYRDGYLCGTVDVQEDGLLYTSIPYDDGWRVYVDGEEQETEIVLDSFLGVNLEKNTHKIEFRYATVGLKYGIIITVVGFGIYVLMLIWGKRNKKGVPVEDEETDQEGDHSGSGSGDTVFAGDKGDPEGDAADR